MKRNPFFSQVSPNYLFQEVQKRAHAYQKEHPKANLLSLGIGDTTQPITSIAAIRMQEYAKNLGTDAGYAGYGPEQGSLELREAIKKKLYNDRIEVDTIFISDGAKCDIGRLQLLFGQEASIGVQDPSYPAYIDSTLIARKNKKEMYLLPCTEANNFMPDLSLAKNADVLFLCSPNNPTGSSFSYQQLNDIVAFAKEYQICIVYDTAYAAFVQKGFPKTIYEIPSAKEVAIEIGSFSKMAGFSGVRLGWTVIPKELKYLSGEAVIDDWKRLISTFFNGACRIAQEGGIAVLSDKGFSEVEKQISTYLHHTNILKNTLVSLNYTVHGGVHAPYLWVGIPGKSSWEAFEFFLKELHIVTTPGIGFGPSGEGFIRISGFAKRAVIAEVVSRLEEYTKRFS